MIVVEEIEIQSIETPAAKSRVHIPRPQGPKVNVGEGERAVSVAAGAILAALGLARRDLPGLLIAGLGGALAHRGVTGHCYAYDAFGVDTAQHKGIQISEAFLIDRPAEQLYQYWRNFENLPSIMRHLEKVEVFDDKSSRWTAHAPLIGCGKITWDAEVVRDIPNEVIAWRSLDGTDVDNSGEIRFAKAPGDRGTEIHVYMDYNPPAGRLGHWIAKMLGESGPQKIRDDLRNFKRMMETGEIPTIEGQPRGTCLGGGTREK